MPPELKREDFTTWLKDHKKQGTEFVGRRAESCECPVSRYLQIKYNELISVGCNTASNKSTTVKLDRWAVEFIKCIDRSYKPARVSPQECLDLLGRIPNGI